MSSEISRAVTIASLPFLGPAGPWVDEAVCKGAPRDTFFTLTPMAVGEAKAMCRRCPVLEECLRFAVTNKVESGVWGGTDELQRRAQLVLAHKTRQVGGYYDALLRMARPDDKEAPSVA